MKLTFKILGFEIASLDLDLDLGTPDAGQVASYVASKPVKKISQLWVKGMTR
ncbi:hypothetical protein SEA_YECEY3_67 [Mycobacterium phage Yecey3]|uniref:Uncharacterized protein n=1 Tax=Mycobacterium phage Yecey3 TaxID=2656617 RepID=A0A649V8Y7_9CAUD|nr:hypothetical protein KIV58_gp042 [Mycobacterium phage Yecey3]QGJ88818.1 hypothetical protein SEA_YECEY3_67 [Mycobacterium phage Yecey3]